MPKAFPTVFAPVYYLRYTENQLIIENEKADSVSQFFILAGLVFQNDRVRGYGFGVCCSFLAEIRTSRMSVGGANTTGTASTNTLLLSNP